jgi:hypothetical protein
MTAHQPDTPSVPPEYRLTFRIRKLYLWIVLIAAAGIYLWLVSRTMFDYFMITHGGSPFPKDHVFPAQLIPGCQAKLSKEYALGSASKQFSRRIYWRQMLLLDRSAISYNNSGILADPACLGARIQGLMTEPFPVNYYIVQDPDSPPVMFLHKD